jgi:hypothetical protein
MRDLEGLRARFTGHAERDMALRRSFGKWTKCFSLSSNECRYEWALEERERVG